MHQRVGRCAHKYLAGPGGTRSCIWSITGKHSRGRGVIRESCGRVAPCPMSNCTVSSSGWSHHRAVGWLNAADQRVAVWAYHPEGSVGAPEAARAGKVTRARCAGDF
jgi:hypothetical protein